MPTPMPRLTVATALRPARESGPGEDRVFTTSNAVIVLDGASQPEPSERDGGWLAETLGSELRNRLVLQPYASLPGLLAAGIATVADRHSLTPGAAPSATVAVARWAGERVDALVLGDTPIVAEMCSGRIEQLRDQRLHQVAGAERARLRAAHGPADPLRRALVEAERQARNSEGGYWIAEADPAAAYHAVTTTWPLAELSALVVATDGVALGPDRLGVPGGWRTAIALARRDPRALLDHVHEAESADPDRSCWPRSKTHDDKAIAVVQFAAERSRR